MRLLTLASVALLVTSPLAAQGTPSAIATDAPHDTAHPARSQVLHIPSGGVRINGLAYLPAGAGRHPTLVILHGFPGNEKNLDLAQAVRRAGWNAVTMNYRGSWGSPGDFRFGNVFEDAAAALAFLRDSANAQSLGVDPSRIVLAGHSMGGWATAITASHDRGLRGVVLISMADMSQIAMMPRAAAVEHMAGDMESLAGVTAESLADDLMAGAPRWHVVDAAAGLASTPMLVLTSDDGLAPHADALVTAVRAKGNSHVTTVHSATDHSWSDRRIFLESEIIRWLNGIAR